MRDSTLPQNQYSPPMADAELNLANHNLSGFGNFFGIAFNYHVCLFFYFFPRGFEIHRNRFEGL